MKPQFKIGVWLALTLYLFTMSIRSISGTESTEIVFWHYYDDGRGEFLAEMIEEFNSENPHGVEVVLQYFSDYDRQHDAILRGLVENNGLPNVAFVRNYHAALYQLSDALVDLTPYFDDDSFGLDPDDFFPAIWQSDASNGQQPGLPLTRSFLALYINMDALREVGHSTPPAAREEMAKMACDFKKTGWSGTSEFDVIGYDIPADASFFITLAQPTEILRDSVFRFDTPEFSATVGFLKQQIAGGCATIAASPVEAQTRFALGKTLFYIDSSGSRAYVEDAVGMFFAVPFELAVFPLPAVDGPVLNLYGTSLSIIHHDDESDRAAWNLLRWLAQPENMSRWAKNTGTLPARHDVPAEFSLNETQWLIEPHMAGYDLIWDEIAFSMIGILSRGESSLAELETNANAILEAFTMEPDHE